MTFFSLVADFVGLDPRIAAWLIDPSEAAPSFEDLVAKYLGNAVTAEASSTRGNASGDMVSGFGVRCVGTARTTRRPAAKGASWAFALARSVQMFSPFTLSSRGGCG